MARRQRQVNQTPKKRITAAALAFFGGTFGIHKFYLRETGTGIFYVMLFLLTIRLFALPLSFLLGVFDGMRLLGMSDEKFDHKYNKDIIRYDDTLRDRQIRRRSPMIKKETKTSVRRSRTKPRYNPFKKSGLKKYKDFDLDGAIDDFKQGLAIEPDDPTLLFNLACAYSLNEQKDLAYKHIDQAIANGFSDSDKILTHDDLAYIRIQKEFDAFKAAGFRLDNIQSSDAGSNENHKKQAQEEPMNDVLLAQLNKLAELRKKGLLSKEEFDLEKKKLLRR